MSENSRFNNHVFFCFFFHIVSAKHMQTLGGDTIFMYKIKLTKY